MKKIILSLSILALLSSCYSIKTTQSIHYIPAGVKLKTPTKEGEACASPIGLFDFDYHSDTTIETARKKAGITEISSVESEVRGKLFSREYCTIVRGD